MPIPPFNESGWLPDGIYSCTIEEAGRRFGSFQKSDRRPRLWTRFIEFVRAAKASGIVKAIVVDGSFVTSKADPNDIDLVVVLIPECDLASNLAANHFDILSQKRVRKAFGFDIMVVKDGTENLDDAVGFFRQVRQRPGEKKGLLEIVP